MENILYCYKCNLDKKEEEFNFCKSSKTGRQSKCRKCEGEYKSNVDKEKRNEKARIRYQSRKDKEAIRRKKYYENNKELIREKARNKHNPEKRREYNNRPEVIKRRKETTLLYRKNNIEKYRKYQNEWSKNRRKTDIHYKMRHRLQSRIRIALIEGKGTKFCPTMEITGISLAELKIHLENQFTEGMTWEKFLNSEIEIDHIKPCCAFDLSKEEEQKKCFHYTNLRPMWAEDNKNKISSDLKQRFIREETTKDISI